MLRLDLHVKKLLLLCILVIGSAVVHAQDALAPSEQSPVSLPGWVVLVLEPIGQDRVRPVTGIVIAPQGLVIVPLDFAAEGDQIIVLDGGTDIATHGRAASIRQQFPELGLTVLSVNGLRRQPPKLSSSPLKNGDELWLTAFPPAELIAQGASPLKVQTQISLAADDSQNADSVQRPVSFAFDQVLPNVTGPLVDSCGFLVGFSTADGVQSMETSFAPGYLWSDGLQQVLSKLSISLAQSPCPVVDAAVVDETPIEHPQSEDSQSSPAQQPAEAEGDQSLDWRASPESVDTESGSSKGLVLLAVVLAALLVGTAFWLVYKKRSRNSVSDEESEDLSWQQVVMPSARPADTPAAQKLDSRADSIVEINGHLPNGKPFQASGGVTAAAVNIVIGREGTDIVIASSELNREHIRLGGSGDMLTISDLGSSRGTWINAVPCLKGEIMYITPGDTIYLGNVSFTIAVHAMNSPSRDS
jgi:hypothetical protein